ncbi:hypothetical protein AB0F49_25310 [Micromonospora ureilytica]|uniref:hypothetical protein n=1 Tax=Micromonospora ureilytica TaxID=709868 RepID=UPI003409F763
MRDIPSRFRARVRHEPDRSYAVLVEGPDGEVLVGATGSLRAVRRVAREGAASLFGMPPERVAEEHLDVVVPQPPYGRDGQWVRIVPAGERECLDFAPVPTNEEVDELRRYLARSAEPPS